MKADNIRVVKQRFWLLLFFLILNAVWLFLWQEKEFVRLMLPVLLLILLLRMIILLRCFVYESSGEVITIRYYHPLQTPKVSAEFPEIKVFSIKRECALFSTFLVIYLKKENSRKIIRLYYRVRGFSDQNFQKMVNDGKELSSDKFSNLQF